MTYSEYEERLEKAAIAFASDYGPLAAAICGDKIARATLAKRLFFAVKNHGLIITIPDDGEARSAHSNRRASDAAEAG